MNVDQQLFKYLDNVGRPVRVKNSDSINSYDSLISVESSFGVGVSANSACNLLNLTDSYSLAGLAEAYFLNRFYYNVPSGNTGQYFKMKSQNLGFGYYNHSSPTQQLDPTAATNNNSFWKVQ